MRIMNRLIILVFFAFTLSVQAQVLRSNSSIAADYTPLIFQYYRDGDYEKAVVLLEKMFAGANNEGYFDIYFNSLLKLKRYDVAEKTVKKLMRQHPENDAYSIALGKLYQEKGDVQNGNKIFSDIISKLPKDEFKIRNLANNFYRFENYDFAVQTFKQGRKILGNNELFTYELLNIYRFKKDKPMLGVYKVYSIASKNLSLPYKVIKK